MSQNNSITINYIGVDVAKLSLAADLPGQCLTVGNDIKGHDHLLRLFGALPNAHVVLEATGGYEQSFVRALHCAGIAVSVIEPSKARAFARAKGLRAKTDPIDAALLRGFGVAMAPHPTAPPTAQQQRLAELVMRRRQLVDSVTCESNRSDHYLDPLANRQAAAHLRLLRKQTDQCDKAIAALIAADEVLAQRSARLQELPGVGAVTASTLIAEMPELGTLSDEGAAALAGVAPYNCDSGPFAGSRRIAGGRISVRCCLYMAAMSARVHDPILKTFYNRLVARGKKRIVALTAVMRKLIILLNRMLKNPNFELKAA